MQFYVAKLDNQTECSVPTELLAYVNPQKASRLRGFSSSIDFRLSLLAELLVKYVISKKFNISFADVEISCGKRGKPYSMPIATFNISHSCEYVLCVFSKSGEVGIDIEKIRDIGVFALNAVCTENEKSVIFKSNDIDFNAFFRIWTAKESYAKCKNISMDDCFEMLRAKACSVDEVLLQYKKATKHYFYQTTSLIDGYVVSACTAEMELPESVECFSENEIYTYANNIWRKY